MDAYDVACAMTALAHAYTAPYCKVEESFALQATHDFMFLGLDVASYDHRAFPGVVPRTAIASLALAALARGPWAVWRAVRGTGETKAAARGAARGALGVALARSHAKFRGDVKYAFGDVVGALVAIVSLCEFHMWFYASRPLMNVFALAATLRGCGAWIRSTRSRERTDVREAVIYITVATFLLRCDVVLLLAPMGLHMLASGLISAPRAVGLGSVVALLTIATSTLVDSWFWGRFVWPEGAVLYFNTALNKSSEWGTSPWHWYFSSALPKSLLCAYPLALMSVFIERRARPIMFAALFYVGMYSFLPHKELRFIFPTLPLFNVAAATTLSRVWNNRRKRPLVAVIAAGLLFTSLALVCVFTAASSVNYPGGVAFHRLHHDANVAPRPGSVHVDVPAAMTGVSRFGEAASASSGWSYSKTEGLSVSAFADHGFDYLLNAHEHVPGYEVAFVADGYAGLAVDVKSAPSVLRVKTKPEIYVHRRASLEH